MASGLRWAAGIAGGCILAAAWILSSQPDVLAGGWSDSERRVRELAFRISAENDVLQQWLRLDSLSALLPDRAGLATALPADVPDTVAMRVDRRLREATGRAGNAVRLGVFLVDATWGGHPEAPAGAGGSALQYYGGAGERGSFCMVVALRPKSGPGRPAPDLAGLTDLAADSLPGHVEAQQALGPCYWWARYGAPGRGIGEWLAARDYAPALLPTASPVPDSVRGTQRGLYGTSRLRDYALELDAERCLAGRPGACGEAMVEPEPSVNWRGWRDPVRERGPTLATRPAYRVPGDFAGYEAAFLADVERAWGPERFARFWASDAEPAQAFEAVFGAEMDRWTRGWAQARLGPEVATPWAGWGTLLLSLIAIAALAGAAVAVAMRRQIG